MSRIPNASARLLPHSRNDRLLVVEAWLTVLWVAALLRTPWRKRLFRVKPMPAKPRLSQSQVERVTWLVNAAAHRHIKPMTCLERALTLQFVLARRGCRADLRFGIQKSKNTDLTAHAWLEGLPGLRDPLSPGFIPLKPVPERS